MKTNHRQLLYLFVFVSLLSCIKDIEIDIPPEKSKMVAICNLRPLSFTNIQLISLELQSSTPVFDGKEIEYIKDALVIVNRDNNSFDTISYVDTLDRYVFKYGINDYPISEEKFDLTIIKEGYETVYSSTSIPEKVNIEHSSITPIAFFEDNLPQSEATIQFKDPVEEENYYEVIVSDITEQKGTYSQLSTNNHIITSESYYPSAFEFDKSKPRSLLFSDKMINGQKVNINVFYSVRSIDKIGDISIIPPHYITLHLRNVSKEYYLYKTTLLQHLYSLDENILYGSGEPIPVYSNIKNGYGLFGSYNSSIASHKIEKIIY